MDILLTLWAWIWKSFVTLFTFPIDALSMGYTLFKDGSYLWAIPTILSALILCIYFFSQTISSFISGLTDDQKLKREHERIQREYSDRLDEIDEEKYAQYLTAINYSYNPLLRVVHNRLLKKLSGYALLFVIIVYFVPFNDSHNTSELWIWVWN